MNPSSFFFQSFYCFLKPLDSLKAQNPNRPFVLNNNAEFPEGSLRLTHTIFVFCSHSATV